MFFNTNKIHNSLLILYLIPFYTKYKKKLEEFNEIGEVNFIQIRMKITEQNSIYFDLNFLCNVQLEKKKTKKK